MTPRAAGKIVAGKSYQSGGAGPVAFDAETSKISAPADVLSEICQTGITKVSVSSHDEALEIFALRKQLTANLGNQLGYLGDPELGIIVKDIIA